jgi:hypothetical protein
MDAQMNADHPRMNDPVDVVLVAGTVILTLSTAYIHSTLGGLLFTLNAIGYTVLALALIVPIPLFARFRWGIRLALLAFVLATIGGWMMFGARYDVAYLSKAIEVVLIGFLLVSIYRFDGGVAGVIAHLRALPADLTGLVRGAR